MAQVKGFALEKEQDEFLNMITSIKRKIAGSEVFGTTTEFYDEDGVVLMTSEEIDGNTIQFKFSDMDEAFNYSSNS